MALITFSCPPKSEPPAAAEACNSLQEFQRPYSSTWIKTRRGIAQQSEQSFYAPNAEFSYHPWSCHSAPSFCLKVVWLLLRTVNIQAGHASGLPLSTFPLDLHSADTSETETL